MQELKSGRVAGKDGTGLKMLKALNKKAVRWFTKVCLVAWKSEKKTENGQT